MKQLRKLNDSERASLYFYLIEGVKDWERIYCIAVGEERFNNLTPNSKQANTSRWKRSARVQFGLGEIKKEFEERENKIKELAVNELGETETPKSKGKDIKTDFLNRDEFLQFLNVRANQITDDKLRNDILKMLSDNLRYKESDKEESNEIQRFYTPMICKECPIYRKCSFCKVEECPKVL